MAITSIVTLSVRPEHAASAATAIEESLVLTRGFAGNLGVDVLADPTDDTRWVLVERWESDEADTAYRAYRRDNNIPSALGPLLAGAPEVTKYDLISS